MDMKKIVEDVEVSSHQSQAWNIFDKNDDTCWFSGHGHKQYIDIYLHKTVHIRRVFVHFQKEFHCTKGSGWIGDSSREVSMTYPGETNEGCLFFEESGDHIRIALEESSDIYGRYCIYKVEFEL